MYKNHEEYQKLIEALDNKLKGINKNIVFLELNKDVFTSSLYGISKDTPFPIRSQDLLDGIKSGVFVDSIPFEKFIEGMILLIGSDSEFKYNTCYIDLLKKTSDKIDSFILNKALELAENKEYLTALIYFKTLDKISDKHMYAGYNIANTLRELAVESKAKEDKESYELYYNLSFAEFDSLSHEYPELLYAHYYLGFYFMEERDYENALTAWSKAYSLADDEGLKRELSGLIDGVNEGVLFEKGKDQIVEGDIAQGLKILIPLVDKHNDWSEVKYFAALGYRKLGNFNKAELLLNELLACGEDFSEIYNELGLCYFNLGDNQKSIQSLEKAVELKPYDQGYLCNLGIAYYNSGDAVKAKEVIYKAYNLKSDDELTEKCKRWIDSIIK